ncbi:MAG: hypothetical protein Q7T96_14720 [Methylobacter sp.]|nr:hypothetical protein [Methylobacter sp.]
MSVRYGNMESGRLCHLAPSELPPQSRLKQYCLTGFKVSIVTVTVIICYQGRRATSQAWQGGSCRHRPNLNTILLPVAGVLLFALVGGKFIRRQVYAGVFRYR